ncbi:MAG: histidinol-phosphate transaminase [Ignavibacteriae bacterium]|nr:MAG: histidinol-phosphate transaminase [Ignavibacteriota bacterium]
MNIESLVRTNIRALKPYHSARQDFLSGILLDANENSFGSTMSETGLSLNRYPDPSQHELRVALAGMNGVAVEHVFVGVGSDEVIDLLVRIFCEPRKDSIVLLEPTYGMYRVAASIQDVEVRSCLLTDKFQIDMDAVKNTLSKSTKLIFCCSPNNPTANLLKPDDILAMCDLGPLVIVDEAYIDFAPSSSMAKQVLTHPQLVVMRTLSKAWGLAGIRLGYCIADPVIQSYMMKVKAPYNINALTSRTAVQALRKKDELRRSIDAIVCERERLSQALASLPCITQVFPSDANFILVRCTDAGALYASLVKKEIIVRNRSTEPLLKNCLRITVGTREENEQLLLAIKEYGA